MAPVDSNSTRRGRVGFSELLCVPGSIDGGVTLRWSFPSSVGASAKDRSPPLLAGRGRFPSVGLSEHSDELRSSRQASTPKRAGPNAVEVDRRLCGDTRIPSSRKGPADNPSEDRHAAFGLALADLDTIHCSRAGFMWEMQAARLQFDSTSRDRAQHLLHRGHRGGARIHPALEKSTMRYGLGFAAASGA